jgi:phosphinothricin acetyltransferase
VAEVSGEPAGYASSREFRAKAAYRQSVETTIYLDPEVVGRGLGRSLYGALLRILESETSVHRAYAGIALPNEASVALHRGLGFRPVGTFHEAGHKFDRYWDVAWYEKDVSGAAGGSDARA